MANDKLFNKRKSKHANTHKRKSVTREAYSRILIVCEGEKTEPIYFEEIRNHYKLSTANIEICGDECGSDPKSVVQYAKTRYQEEKKAGNPFDLVYCVFDRDEHATFDSAIQIIENATPKKTFSAIYSNPCFEYWLLLHFKYTDQPFQKAGSHQKCSDDVIKHLLLEYPSYKKGGKLSGEIIFPKIEIAIKHAKQAVTQAESLDTDNPITYVHELVSKLIKLKDSTENK